MRQGLDSMTRYSVFIPLGPQSVEGKAVSPIRGPVAPCASSSLDKIAMTRTKVAVSWMRTSRRFHRYLKVFPNGKRLVRNCHSGQLASATIVNNMPVPVIPELTIDQRANQKILMYHRHVTEHISQEEK